MSEKNNKLEVFQDLWIKATNIDIRKALLENVTDPWRHAIEREEQFSNPFNTDGDFIAFEYVGQKLPLAGLILWQIEDDYKVTNIVPKLSGQLSYSEYNSLLQNFIEIVAKPASQKYNIELAISSPSSDLSDLISEETLKRLRAFSLLANKSTGSSHPADKQRWEQFIIAAYNEKNHLYSDILMRWLVEIDEWSEELASRLTIEYEQGISLLETYDKERSF